MIPAVVAATFEHYAVITYQKRLIDKEQGSEIKRPQLARFFTPRRYAKGG
jgi:hypothetical protein